MKKHIVIYNEIENKISDPEVLVADEETVHAAEKIFQSLLKRNIDCELVPINLHNFTDVLKGLDEKSVVVNYCEWTGKYYPQGVEVLKILAEKNMVYTGGNWKDFEWSSDKLLMRKIFLDHDFPVLKSRAVAQNEDVTDLDMNYPAIVKTTREHCSIGLDDTSVVFDEASALKKAKSLSNKYQQPVLIEEFAEGNEYQLFIFLTDKGMVTLPVYETEYEKEGGPKLMTYAENWEDEELSKKIKRVGVIQDENKDKLIREMGKKMFSELNMRGYARIDFREKAGELYILEINVNPSIAWTDEYDFISVCATAEGLNFDDILDLVLAGAKLKSI